MIRLHPKVLEKNGQKEFVVLPYEEFIALQELLADAEDLLDLRRAKEEEADAATFTLGEVKSELEAS